MSFTSQIKDELARQDFKRICCQTAELSAIIRMDGGLHLRFHPRRFALHMATENAAVARKVIKLFANLFGMRPKLEIRRSRLSKRNNYAIKIDEEVKLSQALNELAILDDSLNLRYDIAPRLVRKECCAVAYLRGLFMGGGFVSHPHGDYHFELVSDNYTLVENTQALAARFNLRLKISSRKKKYSLYLKGAEPIVQLLALIGAHTALLQWEDVRILKAMRSSANRLVNCDTANLNKAVTAAFSQLSDIALIEEKMGIDNLPGGLAEIAKARLSNPQLSLRELGEAVEPPLSKSAVYHRIRRLRRLAGKIRQ